MEFLQKAYSALDIPFLAAFFFFFAPLNGMDTVYSNKVKIDPSWIQVAMNEGRSTTIPECPQNPTTFWTDGLKGCVVTLIHLEHHNGDRTIAMCHFSHDKKSYNELYLKNLLSSLERENKLGTLKTASCIIIPPGVPENKKINPIMDPEWKRLIFETVCAHIPTINITIKPYLFNIDSSGVKYTLDQKNAHAIIINKSGQEDLSHQNQLLISHSYQEESICQRFAPLIVAAGGIIGFFIYNSQ